MTTEQILWTLRVDDPRASFVPGSIVKRCARCDSEVNFSPSSNEIIEKYPAAVVVCLDCMTDDDRAAILQAMTAGKVQLEPTERQAGEIGRHFNVGNN
jgi:hypothetical protein